MQSRINLLPSQVQMLMSHKPCLYIQMHCSRSIKFAIILLLLTGFSRIEHVSAVVKGEKNNIHSINSENNQEVLYNIALTDTNERNRNNAQARLKNPDLLQKFIFETTDNNGVWLLSAVINNTENKKELLLRICHEAKNSIVRRDARQRFLALLSSVTDIILQAKAIDSLQLSDSTLIALSGDLDSETTDAREAIARLKLSVDELSNKMGVQNNFRYELTIEPTYKNYYGIGGYTSVSMRGEHVTLRFYKGSVKMAENSWETENFPDTIKTSFETHGGIYSDIPAKIKLLKIFETLFQNDENFTQEDLLKCTASRIPELRIAAIRRISDARLLQKICEESIYSKDKTEALNMIIKMSSDTAMLRKIISDKSSYIDNVNNAKIQLEHLQINSDWPDQNARDFLIYKNRESLKNVNNQLTLKKMYFYVTADSLRRIILWYISDASIIESILFEETTSDLQLHALENLSVRLGCPDEYCTQVRHNEFDTSACQTSQKRYYKIALKHNNPEVRKLAVCYLHNPVLLSDLIKNSKDTTVRIYAIRRYAIWSNKSTDLLKQIALSDSAPAIVAEATIFTQSPFSDQEFIADMRRDYIHTISSIYLYCDSDQGYCMDDFRESGIKKLEDQKVIREITLHDLSSRARQVAVGLCDDTAEVTRIALQDKDRFIRTVAVGKVRDLDILSGIFANDKDCGVRETVVSKITNQELLFSIVMKDTCEDVRVRAVKNIHNSKLLSKILLKEKILWKLVTPAINNIDDPQTLLMLSKVAREWSVSSEAEARLNLLKK